MTSNITKSFNQRKKFGLRMATGGIVEQMNNLANMSNTDRYKLGMSGTAAEASALQERAGILSGLQTAAPAAPAPAATVPSAAAVQPKPYDHMATIQSRGNEIESLGTKLRNMQNSAVRGGKEVGSSMAPLPKVGLRAGGLVMPVEGEGTGTSDDVPVVLAGHEVNVSNGEGVAVLPAKTMRDKAAVRSIENIIENSNGKPVNKGLRDGMAAEQGVVSGDEKKKVVLRDTPYLRGGAANGTQDEYTMAVNGPEAGSRTQVGVINGGPGVGVYGAPPVQKAVEKNKWWHGKATAADSNAYLAGTPQHQEVINDEVKARGLSVAAIPTPSASQLAATPNPKAAKLTEAESIAAENMRDARMTQLATTPRNTLSDAQLAVMDKVIPDRNAQPTLKNGAWTSKNDVTAEYNDSLAGTSPGDPRRLQDGHGIASMRQADGSYKNIVVTPSQYIGVDGKATNNWYDTQAYKDAIARNEKDKATLRDLQYQNAVNSINSHNPAYQQEGLRTISAMLARDNVEADKAAKAASLNLQSSQLRRELNKDAQTQANADRTYEAGREDKFKSRVDDLLKSMSTVDGKVDNQMYSNLQKYASQIPREVVRDEKTGKAREMDDNEYFAWLADNFAVDQITGDAGTHYLTSEKDWKGERTQWKKVKPGLSRFAHGSPMQDVAYEDPVSGRVVYASDIAKMSPQQQRVFMSRVMN